jgi:hypothetical protein
MDGGVGRLFFVGRRLVLDGGLARDEAEGWVFVLRAHASIVASLGAFAKRGRVRACVRVCARFGRP